MMLHLIAKSTSEQVYISNSLTILECMSE